MRRAFERYASVMDGVSVFVGQACSVLFFACIVISAGEVVMRYGFHRPTIWSTELVMTLCATAWVLSVGYVTERNRHISITMLEIVVGPRAWHLFRLFQLLIAIVAFGVLVLALWKPAMHSLVSPQRTGSALNSIQPTYFKVLMVVGVSFYILQLLANLIRWVLKTEKIDGNGN